jgi:hypothetical protein
MGYFHRVRRLRDFGPFSRPGRTSGAALARSFLCRSGRNRHVTVPDSARATVDGKELSVHDLKPGMKLQRTIATTTTPKAVTTVRTIQSKVFHVNAPALSF